MSSETRNGQTQYYQVIRDLTPGEICQHYEKIIADLKAEIEALKKENLKLTRMINNSPREEFYIGRKTAER
jgi:hypothetical protein